ncbi:MULTISPECIES: DMT family transporter [Tsukamurella]|uniref:DMT family transporter n=2 Tax=Tsukamurella TaxID=2060 RepID=A0A5C5S3T3_9ACTN|nr:MULTISPECIES: DMT family transporter [Tsukamurella]NMD57617.1 DMT family transporter [Tsukamurella columbiensis]TWS29273.1 DMT family transporter [Tsukamurella conjunctivitidis]
MVRTVSLQFAALALAWGSSFLFIKEGLAGLSPVQVTAARMTIGAVVLAGVAIAVRAPLIRDPRAVAHIAVVSLTLCVIPFTLFGWAEQRIDSGLASIINATTPLMTVLVTCVALRSERPTRNQLAGLGVGFAGVLLVLAPWASGAAGSAAGQLACLAATASYGVAFVHLRRFVTPLALPAPSVALYQVGIGAFVIDVCALAVDRHAATATPRVALAMLALGAFGTGLAYLWNTNIVAAWGAAAAASVTYLTPVVGVLLGVAVLGERPAWHQPVGGLVVLAGIVLSRRGGRAPRPPDGVPDRAARRPRTTPR